MVSELTFLLAESGVPFLQEEEEGESCAGLQSINFTKTCIYATELLTAYKDKHETNPRPSHRSWIPFSSVYL
jgi:hypothetical protein